MPISLPPPTPALTEDVTVQGTTYTVIWWTTPPAMDQPHRVLSEEWVDDPVTQHMTRHVRAWEPA